MGALLMPSLGSDMEAGTLVEWLVAPGDRVRRGDVVAVVETQKGAIEIEIFEDGEVDRLVVEPGTKVPVGTRLAEIRGEGAAPPKRETAPAASPFPPEPTQPSRRTVEPPPQTTDEFPLSSPAARSLARERGADLKRMAGSGPGGAILLADVERAVVPPPLQPKAGGFDPAAMRAAIAAAMTRSNREIPHFRLTHQIDLQAATDWLAATNAGRDPETRLAMGLLLVRATALAARKHGGLNGFWEDGAFRPADGVHPGVAVSLRGGGLVAPALRDADRRDLDALMQAMRDLVTRARTGRLRSSEVSDPTITVSSLGERGVDALHGVIFPPQVALVGFGTPTARPVALEDGIAPRVVVFATLAADHRASDGRAGAGFLSEIARLLQRPEKL